jgi:hypothetical protein
VKDTTDLKYSAAENFLVREQSLSVIFAMEIGHKEFLRLTEKYPFTETKQRIGQFFERNTVQSCCS